MREHPFDIRQFVKDNRTLVKKYIRKNTYSVQVDDVFLDASYYYQKNEQILNKKDKPEYTLMQKLEYIKCMRDCSYFTQKYIKIISIDDGVIPFNLYDYQHELLKKYQDNRFVITLQARQTGKTQTTAAYILWFNTFHDSKNTAILANRLPQAQEIMERVQMSYENLPNFLKKGVTEYNKRSMTFSNYSKIFCATSTSSSIRGKSVSLLYIDECAFLRDDMTFYESTYPTISSGKESRVIVSSTPNGARGLFYKLWTESTNNINKYVNHKVTWDMVPGRDNEWKEEQIANTSREQFDQEHNCLFRGSINSLIAGNVLARLPERTPIDVRDDLKIFEEPIKADGEDIKHDHIYVTVVDVSRGLGQDFSAFIVVDVTQVPYRIVATYRNNKISPVLYPTIINSTARHYNNSMVLVEINDIGEQVASILFDEYEYEDLLMTKSVKNRQTIWYGSECKLGVRTTTAVKAVGCSNIKTLIENDKIELNDKAVIDEFGTFVPKGNSYEADSGANDDFAMCCVLFGWATTQQYFKDMTDINTREELLKSRDNNEGLTPFGFIEREFDDLEEEQEYNHFGISEGVVDHSDPFFDGF
jgi:phage terminase large subunit-like protein